MACSNCGGYGRVSQKDSYGNLREVICPDCQGSGKGPGDYSQGGSGNGSNSSPSEDLAGVVLIIVGVIFLLSLL